MVKLKAKFKDITNLILSLIVIILLNFVGSFLFHRLDLTSEKRHSISDSSIELIKKLEGGVFIQVYLGGDLPAGFTRLKNATKETLDELRAYSSNKIDYEFINPSESTNKKERNAMYKRLTERGLQYSNIKIQTGDKYSEQIIFPGAIISIGEKEVPIQLLKSQMGTAPEVMLNNSIQQLEYEIVSAIKKISRRVKPQLAFIEGHGELSEIEVADITKTLQDFYDVKRVKLDEQVNALRDVSAIIIAKPDSSFSEKDKFIIDQFIMKGGKSLWLIDPVFASMDSLKGRSTTMAIPLDNNLDDLFFKYGVRLNKNLIMDLQAIPIPIVTGMVGNQPKQELFPWYYFPLIMSANNKHPIVNDLDAIKTEFVSTIDTIGNKDIKKTILLSSSNRTKIVNAPTRVSFNVLRTPPDKRQFSRIYQPMAVLLEGKFNSVFTNRIPPNLKNDSKFNFKEKCIVSNKMIVISDGDIIKNEVNKGGNRFFGLGYDKYTQRTYGNKDFIMNAINYLCDDSGLIQARAKDFKLRLLDKEVLDNERVKWQTINVALPIVIVVLLGLIITFIRKKKYI